MPDQLIDPNGYPGSTGLPVGLIGPAAAEQLGDDLVVGGLPGIALAESMDPMRSNADLMHRLGTTTLADPSLAAETFRSLGDAYTKHYDEETREVHISSRLTLADYEAVTPPDIWGNLIEYAEANVGKTIIRINATPYGGGVAIMNESWVHIMRELGVDAHWYALDKDKAGSQVTKFRFHNGMQNVAPEAEITLTEEDKKVYEAWIDRNAVALEGPIRAADVVIIDDAQPSRLIRYTKGFIEETADGPVEHEGWNTDAPLLYRDHIHSEGKLMVTPGTPQHTIWQYLWEYNGIKKADIFIIHPVDEFAPPNVPDEMIVKMPAAVDKLGDLLRDLSTEEVEEGFEFINEQLAQNQEQTPIDRERPYIVLIARFDESKGMPQGMESYLRARELMSAQGVPENELPQLVIIGNGAYDDPSGDKELAKVMDIRASETFSDIAGDIKVARVPHKDTAINAILRGAMLALQPSTKEGFESRVTDAIMLGVPTIGSTRGGIPKQIVEPTTEHGEFVGGSGYIIDPYDTKQWGQRIFELSTDKARYAAMKTATAILARTHNEEFTTTQNVTNWLYLSQKLLEDRDGFSGDRRKVSEMAATESRARLVHSA
jgi:glycosyltransferase involved in cell wall biosynthesis